MTLFEDFTKDTYSEADAARELGISMARLFELLDRYVFNDGTRRPQHMRFNSSDLLLLEYWNTQLPSNLGTGKSNVVSIKDRK